VTNRDTADLDAVLAWVSSDAPKSADDLRRASDLLGRHARTPGVPEARMRVAVILERMGR
jgi:hypothetical protein